MPRCRSRVVFLCTVVLLLATASCARAANYHTIDNVLRSLESLLRSTNTDVQAGDTLAYGINLYPPSPGPVTTDNFFKRGLEVTKQNLTIAGWPLQTFIIPNPISLSSASPGIGGLLYSNDGSGNGLSLSHLTITGAQISTQVSIPGGLINVSNYSSAEGGAAILGTLTSMQFINNAVRSDGGQSISGGGLVGALSDLGVATVGGVTDSNTWFIGNTVTMGYNNGISGGGLLGAFSDHRTATENTATATLTAVNGRYDGNSITTGTMMNNERGNIAGGGLAGAYSNSGKAAIDSIQGFFAAQSTNTINAGRIQGGGLVGAAANGYNGGNATIDNVSGDFGTKGKNVVNGVKVLGGGLVGAYARNDASIDDIAATSVFGNADGGNTVTLAASGNDHGLWGGGLVGVESGDAATIGTVGGTYRNNTIRVNSNGDDAGLVGGGLAGAMSSGDATRTIRVPIGSAAVRSAAGTTTNGSKSTR